MYRSRSQQFAHLRLNPNKVVDLLNEYLDDFESKLEFNRFDQVDVQVPRLIIAKFKRLLELWRDNQTISKYLKRDLFEDVYFLMTDVLNEYDFRRSIDSSSDSSQDGPLTIMESESNYDAGDTLNNFIEHSYALQITSFGKFTSNSMLTDDRSNDESGEQGIFTGRISNEKGINFRCFLCRVSIRVDEEEGSVSLDDVITSHEQEDEHRFNLLVFQSHQKNVKVFNRDEDSFQCTLCGEIFHLHLLLEHFANSQHTKRKLIAGIQSSTQNLNVDHPRIEFVTQIINDNGIFTKCHLCRTSIPISASIPGSSRSLKNYLDDIADAHVNNEIHRFHQLVFYSHQPFITTRNHDSYICTLCDQTLYPDTLMNHFTNSNHTKLKLLSTCIEEVENFNELQIDFIAQTAIEEGNLTKCHLCQKAIYAGSPDPDDDDYIDTIEAHRRSVDHRFNCLVYKSHERFFRVINETRNFFQCELCGQVFFLGSLMKHFTDFKHTKMKLLKTCDM